MVPTTNRKENSGQTRSLGDGYLEKEPTVKNLKLIERPLDYCKILIKTTEVDGYRQRGANKNVLLGV